jgi:hypothetical protein
MKNIASIDLKSLKVLQERTTKKLQKMNYDYEVRAANGGLQERDMNTRNPEPPWTAAECSWEPGVKDASVLELLHNKRILRVCTKDKKAIFVDGCDEYFSIGLQPEVLAMLIAELQEILDEIQ